MKSYIADDALVSMCSRLEEPVRIYARADVRGSEVGRLVSIGSDTSIVRSVLSSNTEVNRRNFVFRTSLGRFSYTGIGTMMRSAVVGQFCSISWNVSIGGGNHDYQSVSTGTEWRFISLDTGVPPPSFEYERLGHCVVGNDVWIGSGATILRNVSIGNGAVVAAGAVVNKDVEPYSIVAGVPAKIIGKRFDEKAIGVLEQVKWWDWPLDVIRKNISLIYCDRLDAETLGRLKEINGLLE